MTALSASNTVHLKVSLEGRDLRLAVRWLPTRRVCAKLEFMNDFLRSMRGEAGPRISRGAIKRLRWCRFALMLGWIAIWFPIFWVLGRDVVSNNVWPAAAVVVPLLALIVLSGCCETQIRHLNGLAFSPSETGRMDRAGAKRMWIGNILMMTAVGLLFATPSLPDGSGSPYAPIWVGTCLVMMVAGYILSAYKTGLGWISLPSLRYYDPDEDEWTFSGGWPR